MGGDKRKAELIVYGLGTFLTLTGTVLCLTGLLLPYWYRTFILEGIVVVGKAKLGLWQDEICIHNTDCKTYWLSDDDYDRKDNMDFPYWNVIRGVETAGTAAALLALVAVVPFWVFFRSNRNTLRLIAFSVFYGASIFAGFLSIIGCLVISSKGNNDDIDIAPVLSGVGGGLMFISACLSCAVCRYNPTYGTLENPVSHKFSRA